MLKLYHLDRSPYGWKARFVLEEKKIPYEGIVPQNKSEDPDFAKLNPFRLTPVLVLEDGRAIYESTVIAEYLEEAFPERALLPKDLYERARVRLLEDVADQYVGQAMRELRATLFDYRPPKLNRRPEGEVDAAALEAARRKVHDNLHRLEGELQGRSWFGGSMFSLADVALATFLLGWIEWMGVLPDPHRYPNLAAWRGRIQERPAYEASKPKEPPQIVG